MRGSIGWHGLTGAPFVRGAHRYELQVRGVLSKTPRFVLRTHKDHLPSLTAISVPQGVPPTPTSIDQAAKQLQSSGGSWADATKRAKDLSVAAVQATGSSWIECYPSYMLTKPKHD